MIPVKDKYQLRNWELVSINPNNRDWGWFDFFNFWAVSIQSIIGFSLIASLYLLYDLNSLVVLSGTLFAGLIVFFLTNLSFLIIKMENQREFTILLIVD